MSIEEGLEIDGERVSSGDVSQSEFDAMLAKQVGKTPTPTTEQDQTDLSRQSTEEVLSGLKAPEVGGPQVKDGLTFEEESPRGLSQEELHERAEAVREKARAELAKSAPYRETEQAWAEDHVARVVQTLREAAETGDEEAALLELRNLRRLAGDEYAMNVVGDIQDELDQWDDPDDDEEGSFLDLVWDETFRLDQREAEQSAAVEADRYIRDAVAKQYDSLSTAASDYFRGKRVGDQEASERLEDVYELANQLRALDAQAISPGDQTLDRLQGMLAEYGHETLNLEAFPAERFGEFVALADSWIQQAESESRQSEFRERLLTAESTSVAEGLETETERLAKALERATGTGQSARRTTIDPERVRARAASRVVRAEDILRALTAPEERSVEAGLTNARGRKTSIDKATGADHRHAQAERERRARTMGR